MTPHTRTAFITGASSGIGASFARRFARDGYNLILHGRREVLLKGLCEDLARTCGVKTEYLLGELSNPDDIRRLEERIRTIPDLSVLVNNAGSATINHFSEEEIDGQEAMIRVHTIAPIRCTHAALPGMMARHEGTIINVASTAGFMVSPGSAVYCAVKGFLISFSESLHLEVKTSGVRVQALCPGFTRSDFHERLGYRVGKEFFRGFFSPDFVVAESLRDVAKGKVVSIPGWRYKASVAIRRLLPGRVMYWLVEVYGARQRATKRKFHTRG